MEAKDAIKILKAFPKAWELIKKYKKMLLILAPIYAAIGWIHTRLEYVESIPKLEKEFRGWAYNNDTIVHVLEKRVLSLNHAITGELKARRVGKLKLYLNNIQEREKIPKGGFIYDRKKDLLIEVYWSREDLDYYYFKEKKYLKGGRYYFRSVKYFLNYDD